MKSKKGISLIVLIITIIVVIILAVTIILTISNNNPISSAKEAAFKEDVRGFQDELSLSLSNQYAKNLDTSFNKINTDTLDGIKEYIPSFSSKYVGKIEIQKGKLVSSSGASDDEKDWLKDSNIEEKLITGDVLLKNKDKYIGDFVDYDAGTWTSEEISSVKTGVKGSESSASAGRPKLAYQFGNFDVGSSRNKSGLLKAVDGKELKGWRIYDITENGGVVLISTGCPECYMHLNVNDSSGVYSQYILSGKLPASNSNDVSNNYTKRDYSMYKNNNSLVENVNVLTKEDLDGFFTTYFGIENANTESYETFSKMYRTNKENLFDLKADYYLTTQSWGKYMEYCFFASVYNYSYIRGDGRDTAYGIRILISLKSDAEFSIIDKVDVKNSNSGTSYTYNVLSIQ